MSRGFLLANIDVGLLGDPKLLRLARLVPEEGERACTVLVYLQTVLQSWHDGRRLTVAEAAGLWEPTTERIEALAAALLIDAESRIPTSAWEAYYVPAFERAERRRAAGKMGGKASAKQRRRRSGVASAPLEQRSSDGGPPPNLTPADSPSPEGEGGVGRAGPRPARAPARPPVHMDRLDEADTDALELMLDGLPPADGRRRKLQAELRNRRTVDAGATPDLTAAAEASFTTLGGAWPPQAAPRTGSTQGGRSHA